MAMSKKDFIALASYIRTHNEFHPGTRFSAEQLNVLANFCKDANSHFLRDRWLDYIAGKCGPNGGAR